MELMWVGRLAALLASTVLFVACCIGLVLLARRYVPAIRHVTGASETNFDKAFTFVSLVWSLLFFVLALNALGNFSAYGQAAHAEASDVASAWADAGTFPADTAEQLQQGLACYARIAETEEWLGQPDVPSVPADQTLVGLRNEVAAVPSATWDGQALSGSFLDQLESIEDNRGERLSHAEGTLTAPLWLVYGFVTVLLMAVSLFIPTRAQGARPHVVFVACVALAVGGITAGLAYLDRPGEAGLEWTSMRVVIGRISSTEAGVADCLTQ